MPKEETFVQTELERRLGVVQHDEADDAAHAPLPGRDLAALALLGAFFVVCGLVVGFA